MKSKHTLFTLAAPLFLSCGLTTLTSCSETPNTTKTANQHSELKQVITSTTAEVKKASLTSGIDVGYMDKTVRPQDDFFQYVNGQWLSETQIPADKSNYGAFTALYENSQNALHDIIVQAAQTTHKTPGSDEQKIGDFYTAYMDTSRIELLQTTPIEDDLALINNVENHKEIISIFAELGLKGTKTPFGWYVNNDAKQSELNALYLVQSGLGLPDRDYYLKPELKFENIRTAYTHYVAQLLRIAGLSNHNQLATQVIKLETALAQIQWSRVESRDANKRYNKMTNPTFNALLGPQIDWQVYADQVGFDNAEYVIVSQPSFFEGLGKLFNQTDLKTWQAYLAFHLIDGKAPLLNETINQLHFAFHETTLSGIAEQKPRWRKAVNSADHIIGEILGRLYVQKHFKPEAKIRMETLVNNVIKAYSQAIDELEWMSDKTKKAAQLKLASFTPKIGYPDKWKDYTDLDIKPDDLIGNYERYSRWLTQEYTRRIGKPVDRSEWFMTPQTVNAYYNPVNNEIVFPAAILQPPFFNMEAEDAVNYGGIGAVIGHELGHGFDDQGAKYDGNGNLNNWWSAHDLAEFEKRGALLAQQYSQYQPFDDVNVNGQFTLGENIGDLGGLTVALRAYTLSLNGEKSPTLDGFTGEQRFFLSWAQIWRRLYREEELRRRLLVDPHSPSEYRVIGVVSNIDEFYQAFDVKSDDKMYIAPENRVKIW